MTATYVIFIALLTVGNLAVIAALFTHDVKDGR